jgi:outer membrane protein assembly factor BamB
MPRRISLIVALFLATAGAAAQEWAQWRGANRDGTVRGFAPPAKWPEKLTQVWKTSIGGGYSSPVVRNDRAWVHSRRGEEEVVSAIDLTSGKLLWSKSYQAVWTKNKYAVEMASGPYSTPLLHNGRLYTLGITAVLSCFDAATGELHWRKQFGALDSSKMFTGTAMSPAMEGGNLIVHVGDDRGGKMIAFDGVTGAEKWAWTGDGPGYSSPIVVTLGGVRQVVTLTDKNVVGIAAVDGKLLWKFPWPDEWNENIVTPLLYKDLLIFSGVRRGTVALRVAKTGAEWSAKEAWANADIAMYMSSPVLDGDHLYGMSAKKKGQFFCMEAATGKLRWTTTGREGDSSAVLGSGNLLLILTSDASLVVARKNPQAFEQLGKYSVADSKTYAHPVVIGNRILVRDDTSLALWSL